MTPTRAEEEAERMHCYHVAVQLLETQTICVNDRSYVRGYEDAINRLRAEMSTIHSRLLKSTNIWSAVDTRGRS
jgi:hypothetical protein